MSRHCQELGVCQSRQPACHGCQWQAEAEDQLPKCSPASTRLAALLITAIALASAFVIAIGTTVRAAK